jgi:regulator of sigma E protease
LDQLLSSVIFVILGLFVLTILVFVHESGHFLVAKRAGIKVEEFGFGFPPRILSFHHGETRYSVNALPLGGFVKMLGEEDPRNPRSFAHQTKSWRAAVLLAGPAANVALAILLFAAAYATGWPTVVDDSIMITQVAEGSPASEAGLLPNDVVLRLNGLEVRSIAELQEITRQNLGRAVPIEVQRDRVTLTREVVPRANPPEAQGPIGIRIGPARIDRVAHPIPEALVLGVQQTYQTIGFTFAVPSMVLRGLLPLDVARPVGPVGIVQITSEATSASVNSGWLFPALSVAALISTALAVFNILPIPALDGGRLLFVIIEALRGRRVDPRREGAIHSLGIAVLLSLILVVTYLDLLNPIQTDGFFR